MGTADDSTRTHRTLQERVTSRRTITINELVEALDRGLDASNISPDNPGFEVDLLNALTRHGLLSREGLRAALDDIEQLEARRGA